MIADTFDFLTGPVTLIISSIILLVTGVFVYHSLNHHRSTGSGYAIYAGFLVGFCWFGIHWNLNTILG